MGLVFVRVEPDLTQWGKTLESFEDRTIFQTPAWLSFVAKTQNAEPVSAVLKEGSQTLGYFVGLMVGRLGLKILGSPLPGWTTAYMGFNLLPGVPRSIAVEALTHFAFEELHCVHLELMDRTITVQDLKGLEFEHRMFAGYEIDFTMPEDRLFFNMTSACRRCIRKAEKSGVIVEEAQGLEFADEYYSQLEEVFRKQSLVPTYGVERVRELIRCLYPTGQLLLLRARDSNGRCIATGIFPAMNETMYFWGGASWRQYQILRPNEAIHWYAMRYWKKRGMRRYDMGGGGRYKRKFGGSEICVPWLRKSKYPGVSHMRDIAKRVQSFRQVLSGKLKHSEHRKAKRDVPFVEFY